MAKVGEVRIEAISDVKKGDEIAIEYPLFLATKRRKDFECLTNLEEGQKIRVSVSKIGAIETECFVTGKGFGKQSYGKGEKISLTKLLPTSALHEKMTALEDVKRDEELTVTIETNKY